MCVRMSRSSYFCVEYILFHHLYYEALRAERDRAYLWFILCFFFQILV